MAFVQQSWKPGSGRWIRTPFAGVNRPRPRRLSYSVGHASRPQKDEVQTEVLIDDTKISSSNEDDQKAIDQEYGSATNARGLIKRNRPKKVESTDWMATQLTRRFGLAGGLAWLGILTFGVVSEQVKTRFEVATEEAGKRTLDENSQTEILTPEGLRYKDITIGGGPSPQKGFLIVLHFKAYANGELFEDTYARGKPIVYLYGNRPYAGGTCAGVELGIQSMRVGGRRVVVIPPELGFGPNGATLRPTEHVPGKQGVVPPNAMLTYELELVRVSIPPS